MRTFLVLGFTFVMTMVSHDGYSAVVARIGDESIDEKDLADDKSVFEYNKQAIGVYQSRLDRLNEVILERIAKKEAGKEDPAQYLSKKLAGESKAPSSKEIDEFIAKNVPPQKMPTEADKIADLKSKVTEYLGEMKKDEAKNKLLASWSKKHNVKISLAPDLMKLPSGNLTSDTGPRTGKKEAKVQIVEFSDFQCPFCSRAAEDSVNPIKKHYSKDEVSVQFRHFPLNFHPRAQPSAIASVCADQQGKFWQFHDALFKNQRALEDKDIKQYARKVDLNMAKFNKCIDDPATKAFVEADLQAGMKAGIQSTPTFIVNGKPVAGALPFEIFKAIIDAELQTK